MLILTNICQMEPECIFKVASNGNRMLVTLNPPTDYKEINKGKRDHFLVWSKPQLATREEDPSPKSSNQ